MKEKELFHFGDKELNVDSLLKNITSNLQSYLNYYSSSIPDHNLFIKNVNYIKDGIRNGSITTDGTGVYRDMNGKLSLNDPLMNKALHFVNVIATEQSKQTRSLTQSELAAKKAEETHKKEELERQKAAQEEAQRNTKPAFTPPDGWSVATSFAHSFNQNGQIPYDLLQQLVTTDSDGNPIYTDLYTQLDKNFDSISKQLELFSDTESYINNINLFKDALKDGDLSPQDRFLGMELGFQNSEMDKLNALIKYKIKPDDPISTDPISTEENELIVTTPEPLPEVPVLEQDPLERDDLYLRRVEKVNKQEQKSKNFATKAVNKVNFEKFKSPRSLKNDSEEEFKNYLVEYINDKLRFSNDPEFVYNSPIIGIGMGVSYKPPMLNSKFTKDHIQYIDPKLYNELGLKFFSNYSKTKMYKHFKDLVDKQNKETAKKAKGGILKANNGAKTPWRLNFDGTSHQMEDIYKLFTDNFQSYDSKLISDSLNKLNSEPYTALNFENSDNTLGFKNWNATFNESGLNNLFGYNENKSDYLGVTTRSRKGFVDYLKNKGTINTGNGTISWNPTSKQWEYKDWVAKSSAESDSTSETPEISGTEVIASQGNAEAPTVEALTLKKSDLKKPVDFNSHGVINSLVGYIANEDANALKRKIQKEIPIYLEIAVPEKSFRTAYTYDLEKAKNEIMADANNIQPITSDASVYYNARNEAIKNARAYTSKLDTTINDIVHQANEENKDIAFENAVRRTENANTDAKYIHEWDIEQKQGDVDYIEARNQSFQALNKEIKHNIVTEARRKQKQRDAYVNKHILTGITTGPSNYINGWTKHQDLIWYKGLNNQLETDLEQIEYQQLVSIVNQAAATLLALYENIKYPGIGTLHINDFLKESYDPNKHGTVVVGAKGMKLDKQKMDNFINKIK